MAAARAKKVDPLKAKEAKQKKIAIAGMVVFCALLAVQGPKTLRMLKGPQPVETTQPAPAATTPVAGTPAPTDPAAAGAEGEATAAGAADLASVADSDPAPPAEDGQLVSFERFESKDPFAPQAEDAPTAGAAPDGGTPAVPADEAPSAGGAPAPEDGGPVDGGFTPAPAAPTAPAAPAAPALAAATSIAVNGTAEDVEVEGTFPVAQPTFVLVSLAPNGKSVQIGVAGGSYANGEPTITLKLGTPLTLQNTADGSRYELELLTVEGFAVPKR